MRASMSAVLLALTLACVPACTESGEIDPAAIAAVRGQLEHANAQIAAARGDLQRSLSEAQARDDAAAVERARASLESLAGIEAKAARATAAIDRFVRPDGTIDIGAGASAAGAALPPPWNLLVMLGLPVVVGGIQEWRRTQAVKAAKSIVNSVDQLRIASPVVRTEMEKLAANEETDFSAAMTPLAQRIVASERLT